MFCSLLLINLIFFFLQERKEFEQRFSKEQGAMREQLQVHSLTQMHKFNLSYGATLFVT